MTRDDVMAFLERRSDAYRRFDAAGLASSHAENGRVSSPMFGTVEGRPVIESTYRSLFTVFPDWNMIGEAPIIDGDRVAQLFRVSATHSSDMFGLPATGKRIDFKVVIIYTFDDGLIGEERRIYDFTSVLMQIGVLKGRPAKM